MRELTKLLSKEPPMYLDEFLPKFNISKEQFEKTQLNWDDLISIYINYNSKRSTLENIGEFILKGLMKIDSVHLVRMRTKDPEHLIAKIIRKKIEEPERTINKENYLHEIQDLIGLRAIHLFKQRWFFIHNYIMKNYEVIGKPRGYYREGDPPSFIKKLEKHDIAPFIHQSGYRSIHYNIEIKPGKQKYIAEIQVRTIFEEGWSEIDHKIRYPYNTDNALINTSLQILNRLAGSSDELGNFINLLDLSMLDYEMQIRNLKDEIGKLKINPTEKQSLNKLLDEINDSPNSIHHLISSNFNPTLVDKFNDQLKDLS